MIDSKECFYLSVKDIAQRMSVKTTTVRVWLYRKQMPKPDIQGGRFTRWKASTIENFLLDPRKWQKENGVSK